MAVSAHVHFDAPAPLLPERLDLQARWRAGEPALVMHAPAGRKALSWRELDAAANRVAHALAGEGIGCGDAVAVAMDNRLETVPVLLGIIKAGAAAAPLNLTISDAAIGAMIDDCDAALVVAGATEAERLDTLVPDRRRVVVGGTRSGWGRYEAWVDGRAETAPAVVIRDDDPINVIYSSGTTGRPKGIVHTHRRRLDWALDLAVALRYHGACQTLCTLPLYSNISWVMMLCTFTAGGTLHVVPRFDASTFLDLVSAQAITHTAMVPVQLQRVVEHPTLATRNLSSMQAVMSCGSPLWPALKSRLFDTLPCGVIELYGLTEGVITTLEPEHAGGRVESVGRPLPGTDLRIIDDAGHEVAAGQPGEIVSRGRILMSGYLNREDASVESTWTDPAGRRWLRTGDLGRLDENGFLYIVGRKKDMILSGGQNVYPSDIESVLMTHPQVRDVAVIGVPHPRWGETPMAVVEPSAGCTPDRAELQGWANERLGRFQRISGVELIDALPRNPNGKVLKQALRDQLSARPG